MFALPEAPVPVYEKHVVPLLTTLLNVNVPVAAEERVFVCWELISANVPVTVKKLVAPIAMKLRMTFFMNQVEDVRPELR
jgi:hypothetical protein